MNTISFLQFHLPDGHSTEVTIDVDDETFNKWKQIVVSGFRTSIEILSTGMVSMYIEDPKLGIFDMEVCNNGPAVPLVVKQLIMRFDTEKAKAWRKIVKEEF